MILTCPSCGTRYVVKDGAIPEGGRTVRCAQCKHSWHQDPDADAGASAAASEAEPVQHFPEQGRAEAASQPVLDHELGEPGGTPRAGELGDHAHPDSSYAAGDVDDAQTLPGPDSRPQAGELADRDDAPSPTTIPAGEAETMPHEAAVASDPYPEDVVPAEAPVAEERSSHPLRAARSGAPDLYSPFAEHEANAAAPLRRWLLLGLIALLAIAAIAVAFFFLAPADLKKNVGLAPAASSSPLLLQVKPPSRQELASGNQLLEVSGMVINPTDEPQSVPPLQAQLRSLQQDVVYRWTIPPPAPKLQPGASAPFNSAKLNIPPTAACLDVFFGNPREPQPPCRDGAAGAPQGA